MAETPKATERQARTPLPRPDSEPPQQRFRGPRMQVLGNNVDRISAEGATVEGEFKKDFKYEDNAPVKNFTTEIPVFANSDQLSALLESHDVRIEAEPINQNRGFLASLIL